MSPCLTEVGVHVVLKGSSAKSLMGAKNFRGGGSHGGFVHNEFSSWDWVLFIISGFLDGVVLDHGSHENIIIIGGESAWDNSSIFSISESSSLASMPVLGCELDVRLFFVIVFFISDFSGGGPESNGLGASEEEGSSDCEFHL